MTLGVERWPVPCEARPPVLRGRGLLGGPLPSLAILMPNHHLNEATREQFLVPAQPSNPARRAAPRKHCLQGGQGHAW